MYVHVIKETCHEMQQCGQNKDTDKHYNWYNLFNLEQFSELCIVSSCSDRHLFIVHGWEYKCSGKDFEGGGGLM